MPHIEPVSSSLSFFSPLLPLPPLLPRPHPLCQTRLRFPFHSGRISGLCKISPRGDLDPNARLPEETNSGFSDSLRYRSGMRGIGRGFPGPGWTLRLFRFPVRHHGRPRWRPALGQTHVFALVRSRVGRRVPSPPVAGTDHRMTLDVRMPFGQNERETCVRASPAHSVGISGAGGQGLPALPIPAHGKTQGFA